MLFDSDRTGNHEVFMMNLDGTNVRQLTSDQNQDSWLARLSRDRGRILFHRTPKGVRDTDYRQTSLWLMNADGSNQRMIRAKGADGWEQQGHAEWSPDGTSITLFGGSTLNPHLFVTDAEGKNSRQVTKGGSIHLDPSWSPNGKTLVFVGCLSFICFERDYEIYQIPAAGGEPKRLTNNDKRDHDPQYSPDGTQIVWIQENEPGAFGLNVGSWNIFIMAADGSGQRNVTNDRAITSKPEWALDGSKIYFARFLPGKTEHWSIWSIRPDGTGLTEITKNTPSNNHYPGV
jgi:Tol biopolymer transport system component